MGNSGATPPNGIDAELIGFDSVEALTAAPDAAVRGKIVFVTHAMPRTMDGSGYGQFGAPRRQGPTIASRKGAAAIVIRSIGTDHHRNPHTGVMSFAEGVAPIPAGALSIPDAEQVERILKRGKPVRMRLVLTPRNIGTRQSGNVIAEVPGRDPSLPILLVGGHLDSWDLGTGAVDDAAGVAIAAAAAKAHHGCRPAAAHHPRRLVRRRGSRAVRRPRLSGQARQGSRTTPSPRAISAPTASGRSTANWARRGEAEAKALAEALAPLGIVTGSFDEADGSDIGPMLADGVPGVGLSQDGTHYFDLHHTPDDTLDKVDPEALQAECRGVDDDAGGSVGRDRGAETPAPALNLQTPGDFQ